MYQASEANKLSTLSISEAEYIPSGDYKSLGFRSEWSNRRGDSESKVKFTFTQDDQEYTAAVVLRKARNEGISVEPSIPSALFDVFRNRTSMVSAYIPGLAGIPLAEEKLAKRVVFRKSASGDSNVVLRNVLYLISLDNEKEYELKKIMNKLFPNVTFNVKFRENDDYYIQASMGILGAHALKPLEQSGNGFLQVLQIFSYMVLFNPKIILIDEPESHLHPTLQTKLVNVLQKELRSRDCVALVATHSPYVARGAARNSNFIWLKDGSVVSASSSGEIRDALGWGVLDRAIILFTEDSKQNMLREIVDQNEYLSDRVAIYPYDGIDRLGNEGHIKAIQNALGKAHKVIVHRDRDCLTNEELKNWADPFVKSDISVWITAGSDVEAYFCQPRHISSVYGISIEVAKKIFMQVYSENEGELYRDFENKRSNINQKMYKKSRGSPSTDKLWESLPVLQKIKGKKALSLLRVALNQNGFDLHELRHPDPGCIRALSLLMKLKGLLGGGSLLPD